MIIEWNGSRDIGARSVYQTRAYGMAAGLAAGLDWVSLGDPGGKWHVPLNTRSLGGGAVDVASPYGYPGISLSEGLSREEVAAAWGSSVGLMRENGVVSAFFRFAPYARSFGDFALELAGLRLIHLSDTVLVPVGDIDATWSGMQGRARTAIRKAERAGMTARVTPADESLASERSAFRRLYATSMERLGAASHHLHPDIYYSRLTHGLPLQVHTVEVLTRAGEVGAAALVLVDDGIVHYHLSGSSPEAAREGANNLLIWKILQWGHESGRREVHLGGGTRAGDNLFRFKASFGGGVVPFVVGQLIVDADEYDRRVRDRSSELNVTPRELELTGYFPAYGSKVVA